MSNVDVWFTKKLTESDQSTHEESGMEIKRY